MLVSHWSIFGLLLQCSHSDWLPIIPELCKYLTTNTNNNVFVNSHFLCFIVIMITFAEYLVDKGIDVNRNARDVLSDLAIKEEMVTKEKHDQMIKSHRAMNARLISGLERARLNALQFRLVQDRAWEQATKEMAKVIADSEELPKHRALNKRLLKQLQTARLTTTKFKEVQDRAWDLAAKEMEKVQFEHEKEVLALKETFLLRQRKVLDDLKDAHHKMGLMKETALEKESQWKQEKNQLLTEIGDLKTRKKDRSDDSTVHVIHSSDDSSCRGLESPTTAMVCTASSESELHAANDKLSAENKKQLLLLKQWMVIGLGLKMIVKQYQSIIQDMKTTGETNMAALDNKLYSSSKEIDEYKDQLAKIHDFCTSLLYSRAEVQKQNDVLKALILKLKYRLKRCVEMLKSNQVLIERLLTEHTLKVGDLTNQLMIASMEQSSVTGDKSTESVAVTPVRSSNSTSDVSLPEHASFESFDHDQLTSRLKRIEIISRTQFLRLRLCKKEHRKSQKQLENFRMETGKNFTKMANLYDCLQAKYLTAIKLSKDSENQRENDEQLRTAAAILTQLNDRLVEREAELIQAINFIILKLEQDSLAGCTLDLEARERIKSNMLKELDWLSIIQRSPHLPAVDESGQVIQRTMSMSVERTRRASSITSKPSFVHARSRSIADLPISIQRSKSFSTIPVTGGNKTRRPSQMLSGLTEEDHPDADQVTGQESKGRCYFSWC